MKPQSAKSKGRLLQQMLAKMLVDKFDELEPDDITSRSMGSNGEDVLMSPLARRLIPYSFECKNIKAFAGYNYLEQAVSNCPKNAKPVAVVKANYKKPVVIMYLEDWLSTL